ncbi:MAG: 6-phospho-beta-glucosidase [Christensenellaceae bacterium]|nr:6-phospho-beta-glucosidase [Christensenellaceae bacterium]
MKGLKLTVIGAGSTYTPEIAEGLIARRATLPIKTLCFMDVNLKKMGVVAGLVGRMLEKSLFKGRFIQTDDLGLALDGADYVIAQIRVGGLDARVLDEKLPLKYRLLGQETTGIGGFMQALRTVGPVMDIAREIERRCPNAWFVNFTNPSGILAEAVLGHTSVRMLGLCNCPINMLADVRNEMTQGRDFDYDYVGLNHLSWITSVRLEGRELLTPGAFSTGRGMANIPQVDLPEPLLRAVGAIPSSYLGYYYNREAHLEKCLSAKLSRGEECRVIERNLLDQYADPNLSEKPESLSKRGGALYSTAAVNLINAIHLDSHDRQVVNTRNRGALSFMDADDVVEIPCEISRDDVVPIAPSAPVNAHIVALMRAVKAYEKLTVQAALTGERDGALAALLTHPLIGDYERAGGALGEMLEANRQWLPNFQ